MTVKGFLYFMVDLIFFTALFVLGNYLSHEFLRP